MFRDAPLRFIALALLFASSVILPWFWNPLFMFSIGVFVLSSIAIFDWIWKTVQTRVIITNSYIRVITGIFDQDTTQIFIKDITKFRCKQTVWQRVMGIGRIEVSSSASSETEIEIDSLPRPHMIIQAINSNR